MERNRGFTLIELLIVVAVIGIIAAIAIPNLLNALQRGRQKRSMADMRTVAVAANSYLSDASTFPVGVDNIDALEGHLQPIYLRIVPKRDGWNAEFATTTGSQGRHFTLISYGKNRVADTFYGHGTFTRQFNDDIYFVDNMFTQFPVGLQTGE